LLPDLPQGPVEQKLSSEQFAQLMRSQEERIELSMQADRERLTIEGSNFIPDEVMDQAFELLGVTREQVVQQFDTEEEERKA
jgi:parvulin-like peptidyl-prolyl isomerase